MRSRRTTRGFTIVELLIVIGVASLVLAGLGTLYCATMRGIGDAAAEMAATDQASTAFADMEFSVRDAVVCDAPTLNGVVALRCKMPSVPVDLNGDGLPESYAPASLDKYGAERYALGSRVWYYLANATGTFGTTGPILWRAVVADDGNPSSTTLDLNWTFQYGQANAPRFPLVAAFAPTIDATNDLVTLDLTATGVDYASHGASASDASAQQRGVHLVAQAFWRHWRT